MIDNYEEATALIKNMEAHLPIPVQPKKCFIHAMRNNGIIVKPNQKMQIESVMYLGDEGGIGCCVGLLKKGEVVITSVTHIRVKSSHAIGKEVSEYQNMRLKKLNSQNLRSI